MRLTIIPPDNMVYVDGVAFAVDCTSVVDRAVPGVAVHAVQWNGARGEIEYVREFSSTDVVQNRVIGNIDQFNPWIDAWTNAKAVAQAAGAAAEAATVATPVVKP